MRSRFLLFFILAGGLLLASCGSTPSNPSLGESTKPSPSVPDTSLPSGTALPAQATSAGKANWATAAPTSIPAGLNPARPTPTAWFPLVRYVAASTLPYEPKETIRILPVYACPKQSCLWLGDLPAGLEVQVTSFSEDGKDCFVSGLAVQGYGVEGWVSCSRLAATQTADRP